MKENSILRYLMRAIAEGCLGKPVHVLQMLVYGAMGGEVLLSNV